MLRLGLRPARLTECKQLLTLECVQQRAKDPKNAEDLAYALEAVIDDGLHALGDGPYGRAARLLFGAVPDTRGRALKDRRRLAADELDLMPSTFRHNYEPELLLDVAAEIIRPDHRPRELASSSPKVDR